jgi:hypothetical protein
MSFRSRIEHFEVQNLGGQLPVKKKKKFLPNLGTSCIPYTVKWCEKHVIEKPENPPYSL